jgi:indole-3-glycerol phosphate synthase
VTVAAGDFLAAMARSSRARAEAARALEPEAALRARALATPAAPALVLDGRFDLIAELKLRSPAQGLLSTAVDELERRVTAYAAAGAAIVSVLTEPDRFDGDLLHLARASAALRPYAVPAMRKDFLVDPYQLLEARAAGAGGALLIVRMLGRGALDALAAAAAELGLFVLLEAFDEADVAIATEVASTWRGRPGDCLIGVNSRDLVTLEVVPARLEAIASCLPRACARVAESGLATAADAARLARAGYTVALVGTALMSAADPRELAAEMIARGRAAAHGGMQ